MDNIIINLDDVIRLSTDTLPRIGYSEDIISQSDVITGPAGPQGPAGPAGRDGEAASITVGSTTTGAAGTNAVVQNVGTSNAAILNFTIPRGNTGATGSQGPQGEQGDTGEAATITVGSVTTVASEYPATVTNSGTSSAAVLDFQIPQGTKGDTGEAATITVGSTTTGNAGTNASVTNSGTSSAAVLDFVIPRGNTGSQGPAGADGRDGADGQAATITVGSTTTGNAGTNASVTNSGTSSAAVLDFVIPRGNTGSQGPAGADGQAATIAVGTVTTGAAGSSATVTNSGTSSAAVFDFTIPRGDTGATGSTGPAGADGQAATITVGSTTTGNAGTNASVTNSGTSSAAVLDFVIPRGATGSQGPAGNDGYSPTATVTQNTGSATISITDKNGTTTATVYDGVTPDTTVNSYTITSTPAHSAGTNSYELKKQLNNVNLNVSVIWLNSVTADSWTNLGTLPAAVRPSRDIYCAGVAVKSNGNLLGYCRVEIETTGALNFKCSGSNNALSGVSFTLSWYI